MRMTTDGLVITTANMEDNDRLVTLLSGQAGVVRAYAKGARRPGSKLGGATELLCYSRFVLFSHKERYTVDAADANTLFFGIRQDVDKLALASYWCELSAATSPVGQGAAEQLRLLLNCLHLLEKDGRPGRFLKPLFELRQVSLAGYMPDLVGCSACGCYESPCFHFYPLHGRLICAGCDGGGAGWFEPLPPAVAAAMRHILYAEMGKLFSFSLADGALARLGEVCERYVLAQLDHSFKTLDFYKSLKSPT